ncbi:MAG: aminotransferase class V-fold PLP-dependent enzyme, partial [Candidatus Omnitrophica bacterium]|nr:aminotransferase class V-fold PLP-dependent enzyme [Candidatus Omnitrophota bacterium]
KAITEGLEVFGNPSSLHWFGRKGKEMVERSRRRIASFIGASHPDEIIFMGSGSEANNTVLSMFVCYSRKCPCHMGHGRNIITTEIEHPCIMETSKCIQDRGTKVSYLKVDRRGKIDIDQLENMITDDTGLVSVMMANNEIGTLQDIKKISSIVHEKGVLFHTDAVQAVGKIPVDVRELDVDFLTISGHKMYGPKGIGALYARKGVPFCPMIRGGHQERGRRAGTENTLGIIGLGKAVEMREKEMEEEERRLLGYKRRLIEGIGENIPDVHFNGDMEDSLPGTLNVSFDGTEGESILLYLDLEGIAVSTGSACASGSLDPSHVLLATGMPVELAHDSVRISLGRENTGEDIEYFLKVLPGVISRIRKMSTAYKGSG